MSYLKKIIESGGTWLNFNTSSSRLDYIYGYSGIGSPHGHLVLVNGSLVYQRDVIGLRAEFSGTQLIIQRL